MTAEDTTDERAPDAHVEGTVLVDLLGDGPKVSILAALMADAEADLDYTVTEIADRADVSRTTVYRHLGDLRDLEVIVETRESGGSPRYALNDEHPAAERLAQLQWDLAEYLYGEG